MAVHSIAGDRIGGKRRLSELVQRRKAGENWTVLARDLGYRTPDSARSAYDCATRHERVGSPRSQFARKASERRVLFAKLWCAGKSSQEIADATGLKLSSVTSLACKMNLPTRGNNAKRVGQVPDLPDPVPASTDEDEPEPIWIADAPLTLPRSEALSAIFARCDLILAAADARLRELRERA